MENTEPIGHHLGKDKDVDQSPGLMRTKASVLVLKFREVCIILSKWVEESTFSGVGAVESLLTGRVHWGKVGQTEWDLSQQVEKQGRK